MAVKKYRKFGPEKGPLPKTYSLAHSKDYTVNTGSGSKGSSGVLFWIGILIIAAGFFLDLGNVVMAIGFIITIVGAFV